MTEFRKMVQDDYGVKKKTITKRNPQSNAIVERVHQTIGNMIRSFEVQNMDLDELDTWSGILTTVVFTAIITTHTTTRATLMQLVFGRDTILNISFTSNWKYIEGRKRKFIDHNNIKENTKRIPHIYEQGNLMIIKQPQNIKYGTNPFKGPYIIITANGSNVTIDEGKITDIYNIRQIKPCIGQTF